MQAIEIVWSRYRSYEGPFTRGSARFQLVPNPTFDDEILAVITATEGGRWNAVNMYDRCILTVGLIQWCEAGQFSVSDMLGKVHEKSSELLRPMEMILNSSNAEFAKRGRRWRFAFRDKRGEVDRQQEQRELFLLNSSGHRGTWDSESKAHAKLWALAMVEIFQQDEAIAAQREYTVPRLRRFALPFARNLINQAPDSNLGRAFVASYLSYAANNPTWANKNLKAAVKSTSEPTYSQSWLVHVLRQLTFGPRVQIYPHRYNAIRPVLERLYAVNLPDTSELLEQDLEEFMNPTEVQLILLDLGYDLGPYGVNGDGVDGVITRGGKTWNAVADFQRQYGISEDENDKFGWVGDDTAVALQAARVELNNAERDSDGLIQESERRRVLGIVALGVHDAIEEYFKKARLSRR